MKVQSLSCSVLKLVIFLIKINMLTKYWYNDMKYRINKNIFPIKDSSNIWYRLKNNDTLIKTGFITL